MDVDGTLTDGHIYMGVNGEMMKAFDVKDGYAITRLHSHNIEPVIITGRYSEIVRLRAKELGIAEVYQGISDKLNQLKIVAHKFNCSADDIAYIGDDLNDLECMKYCSASACPNDAVDFVKNNVNYVCQSNGGRGAVREFITWIIENNE